MPEAVMPQSQIREQSACGMKALPGQTVTVNRDDVAFLFKPMRFSFTEHPVAALEWAS
jgi:hypothetical protein